MFESGHDKHVGPAGAIDDDDRMREYGETRQFGASLVFDSRRARRPRGRPQDHEPVAAGVAAVPASTGWPSSAAAWSPSWSSWRIFGPIIWPYDRLDLYPVTRPGGNPPSAEAIIGTDNLGRSVWELVVNGARLSVAFGLVTMLIAVLVGVTLGVIAGFWGGRTDAIIMRTVDLILAVPFLFIILVAASFFGGGDPVMLMIIFGMLSWPVLARLVRALFLSLRELEYVDAARAVGVGDYRIAFRHILPNALGPIIVSATLIVANAIILEAFVSFLNFGIRSTDVSWGTALSQLPGRAHPGQLVVGVLPGHGHRDHGHRHQLHG